MSAFLILLACMPEAKPGVLSIYPGGPSRLCNPPPTDETVCHCHACQNCPAQSRCRLGSQHQNKTGSTAQCDWPFAKLPVMTQSRVWVVGRGREVAKVTAIPHILNTTRWIHHHCKRAVMSLTPCCVWLWPQKRPGT